MREVMLWDIKVIENKGEDDKSRESIADLRHDKQTHTLWHKTNQISMYKM